VTILTENGLNLTTDYILDIYEDSNVTIHSAGMELNEELYGFAWISCLTVSSNFKDASFNIFSGNNLLWNNDLIPEGYNDTISLDSFTVGDTYLIELANGVNAASITFIVNSIPTPIPCSIVHTPAPAPTPTPTPTPQPTPQPTGTYVTHTTILNETYTFNQAMSMVSTSAIGITEILLIVIGVLILVAVPIVVFAKTSYELEVETP
jgi:hypothetical protein